MPERSNYAQAFPEGNGGLVDPEHAIRASGPEPKANWSRSNLMNWLRLCLGDGVINKDALRRRQNGAATETSAWRETSFFTPRERFRPRPDRGDHNIQQGHASDAVCIKKRSVSSVNKN